MRTRNKLLIESSVLKKKNFNVFLDFSGMKKQTVLLCHFGILVEEYVTCNFLWILELH